MTPREQGFLLLTGMLGDPERKALTVAQFRTLATRVQGMNKPTEDRELTEKDLIALGYDRELSQRILHLLSQHEQLQWYLQSGKRKGCVPVTRLGSEYPQALRVKLGLNAPGSLWTKGDLSFLKNPCISLVGSRDLLSENHAFAKALGMQAAKQGYTLVSGNARGADRTAQNSCLAHGGTVISIVADALENYAPHKNILYISEGGFDIGFSAQRAHSRNRLIHCLGQKVFVAQSNLRKGGTWTGTVQNLQHRWTPVFCFDDRSESMGSFCAMGAVPICTADLDDIDNLM